MVAQPDIIFHLYYETQKEAKKEKNYVVKPKCQCGI